MKSCWSLTDVVFFCVAWFTIGVSFCGIVLSRKSTP